MSDASADNKPQKSTPESGTEPKAERLERLYQAHYSELCQYLTRKFGPGPPEPEDIVQLVFAKIAALQDPDSMENPRAFLYKSAQNLMIDHKRRLQTQDRYLEQEGVAADDDAASFDLSPERVLISRDACEKIEAAIRRMPKKRRRCFLLHRIHKLSFAEIGRRMGMSGPGVRKIIEKAMIDCEAALCDAEQANQQKKADS